jgi:peptidoglycan/LPS O-acetylase OafA/YrhL
VLLVVAYHAGIGVISGGYIGVDVFFVISGFLITSHLFRELTTRGRISFAAFYARRATRLLPASVLVVVATLAAAWWWMPPLRARGVSTDALASALYMINYRLAGQGTDYQAALQEPSPLQHFWSLAVEEQFYLFWPVLLFVASLAWTRHRSSHRRPSVVAAGVALALLGIASLAVCVWQTSTAQPWAYFGIQARAWELAAGSLAALAAGRLARLRPVVAAALTWLGLVAVLAAAVLFTNATAFPGYAAVLPVAGALAIVAGGCARPAGSSTLGAELILARAPMQRIGRLSYGWYLWHWPVLMLAPYALGYQPGLALRIALMLLALGAAAASLYAVENPIRFRPLFRAAPRRGLALGGALTTVAAALALLCVQLPMSLDGKGTATDTAQALAAPKSTVDERQQLASLIRGSASTTTVPANVDPPLLQAAGEGPAKGACIEVLEETTVAPAVAGGCDRLGDPTSSTTVVLFGDSHAHQWLPAADKAAQDRHWRLVVFAKHGCTPANAVTIKPGSNQPYRECTAWRANAIAAIQAMHPAMVVMSSLSYANAPLGVSGDADAAWTRASLDTVRTLQKSGATVRILQDTPYPDRNVPECLSGHLTDVQACDLTGDHVTFPQRRAQLAAAAAGAGATMIDPTPWFCQDGICPVIIGNTVVYRDGSHVTSAYATLLAPLLEQAMARP